MSTAAVVKKPVNDTPSQPAAAIPIAAALAEQVRNFKGAQETTVNNLREALEYYQGQVDEIKGLLADLGQGEDAEPTVATTVRSGRGVGTRKGRETTIAGAVEALLLKYKDGLSRADLTGKMLSEMGYETDEGEDAGKKFANNVYTGGVVKLVGDGRVITTGHRPKTIYKHISNASKSEIEAFKK